MKCKEDDVMSRIRDAEHSQLVEQMRRRIAELEIEVRPSTDYTRIRFWDITISGFEKQTYAILEFFFWSRFRPYYRSRHACWIHRSLHAAICHTLWGSVPQILVRPETCCDGELRESYISISIAHIYSVYIGLSSYTILPYCTHPTRKICSVEPGMSIHRVPKKVSCLMFDRPNNFGKCEPIFKILSPGDCEENSLCTHYKDFHLTCNMLLHYLVKVEIKF